MNEYKEWLSQVIRQFVENFFNFFKNIGIWFYNSFAKEPIDYAVSLNNVFNEMNATEKVLGILTLALMYTCFLSLLLLLFVLLRKFFRIRKIARHKESLIREVNVLRFRLGNLSDNQNYVSSAPKAASLSGEKKPKEKFSNRFTKLINLDTQYKGEVLPTIMTENDRLSLKEIVTNFINFAASEHGLYYTYETMVLFIASLAASKTIILEGISGTGKTSLPYVFGKFINNDAKIISVQPSWRDRFEMIGFLNEFTNKFNETEFLKVLYEANYRDDVNIIVLDEMNLARVEYYFADFLSLLELPDPDERKLELVAESLPGDPKLLDQGKIKIPENVWFVGTANNDDSTFSITDKVYDRSGSIVMNQKAESFQGEPTKPINIKYEYLMRLFSDAQFEYPVSDSMKVKLEKLDDFLIEKFQIALGNRLTNQMNRIVPVYKSCGLDENLAIDMIIARKVLRKLESVNIAFLQKELGELNTFFDQTFGRNQMVECKKLLERYIRVI